MPLYSVTNSDRFMEVDDEDIVAISFYVWCYNKKNSSEDIAACIKGKTIRIHQFIANRMGLSLKNDIDHRDRNIFNNKRNNLREATRSQNNINKVAQVNNKLGIKGVRFYERKRKYTAQIQINYKSIHLGYFETIEEARTARIKAEKYYFGEFACVE